MGIFIIAEIGINHNGSMDVAKKLIDVAVDADADAVKFQKRTIELVYTKEMLDSPRESQWGRTQRDQKIGLEFTDSDYKEIDAYCKERSILWSASAWDLESQKFLSKFDLSFNKVASAMLPYKELMQSIASEGRKTFISTGMSDEPMLDRVVDIFRKSNCPFELMHCVSTYPLDDADANLSRIGSLRNRYKCDVGYSGHETGLSLSYGAIGLGATSLERHITLNRSMYGSDQSASVEPAGFRQLVGGVRKIAAGMGDGAIAMNPKEKPVADKLRAHIPQS